MIGFAVYGYLSEKREERKAVTEEQKLQRANRSTWSVFLGAVGMLMVLRSRRRRNGGSDDSLRGTLSKRRSRLFWLRDRSGGGFCG